MAQSPLLSVIIPCRNERRYIANCIRALLDGAYTEIEILVVDGMSEDGTTEVIRVLAGKDSRVRIIANPSRVTPTALNIGLRAAKGEYCAILGAHSVPGADWAEQSVRVLQQYSAVAGVGGVLETVGDSTTGKVIAAVMRSQFGVGNAKFR